MSSPRIVRLVVAALGILASLALAPVPVASADKGLDVTSSYTYTIDPDTDAVQVVADLTFKNTVANRVEGNYVNKTYFGGFSLPLPAEAGHMVATQDGVKLTITPQPLLDASSYYLLDIDFARDLFYNKSAHVVVAYDIIGDPPRTSNPSRVNDAYAAFNAYGIADSGKLTLRVVVPGGYQIDTFGDKAVRTDEGGKIIYTASDIGQPNDFNLFISARDDTALTRTEVTVGDNTFVVRGWPGDADWDTFIKQQITSTVPALQELVGQPWPVDGSLEVREAFTPYLYGYAGWFNESARELEIGEDLDPQVVAHELSHAWFNNSWFADRWINEGFAQTYSELANEAQGMAEQSPLPIDAGDTNRIQLDTWGEPLLADGANAVEEYGYNASWFVIDAVVDEIGPEAMRKVFAATHNATLAYVGDAPPELTTPRVDWHRFLDLLEQVGGSATAQHLLSTYVLTPEQVSELPDRTATLADYEQLNVRGGTWAAPLALRRAMALWDFATANSLITGSNSVLDTRDQLTAAAERLDLVAPTTVEALYEMSDHQLDRAKAQVADQLDAATVVGQATTRNLVNPSLIDKVGLLGTNVQPLLDESRAAFEVGNTNLARAKARQLIAALDGRDDVGRSRVLRIALAFGGMVALLILVLARRRHKRRQPPPPTISQNTFAQLRD